MDDLDAEQQAEVDHLKELRNIVRHRLMLLEKRQAKQGDETPPDVLIAISGAKQELRILEARLRRPSIGSNVLEAVGQEGLYLELSVRIDQAIAMLTGVALQIADVTETQTRTDERLTHVETTVSAGAEWRERETRDRRRGQMEYQRERRLARIVLFAIGLALVVVIALLTQVLP